MNFSFLSFTICKFYWSVVQMQAQFKMEIITTPIWANDEP